MGRGASDRRRVDPDPQERVRRPVMYQRWSWLTFLHWRCDPKEIRPLIPSGLELDTFHGSAWIGVTPFLMEGLRPPGIPPLPWLSRAPETNVRTYVRGPDGRFGIWFFSLDHARLPAVLAARAAYFLPYMWSEMDFKRRGTNVSYRGQRRWPGPGASYRITVEAGDRYEENELDDLDHFLTARWVLFTYYGRVPAAATVEHPRWPLHKGRILRLDQTLLRAAGLPEPRGDPLVHFSPGVDTRISAPRVIRAS
jgi:uncharacterized protein YqjF (DUF2071 family)